MSKRAKNYRVCALGLLCQLLFTAVLMMGAVGVSAETSAKKTQYQVKQLIKTLAKLQVQLKTERSKRSVEERAIQKNEQEIAALGSQISAIEKKRAGLNKNLASFIANKSQLDRQLHQHRQRLSLLLKQRYQLADTSPIKLLLSQKSPEQAARLLMYLDKIRDEEAAQVLAFQAVIAKQLVNDSNIDGTQAALVKQRVSLEKKRDLLRGNRLQRKKNIQKIDRNISLKSSKIKKLAADKKRLQKVIASIEKVIVQKKRVKAKRQVVDNRPFRKLKGKLNWPVTGSLARRFGSIENNLAYDGILIRTSQRSAVKAVHTGHVVFADWLRSYGMLMIVDHGAGYLTLYGHNDQLNKKVGDKVAPGEVIALAGSSGGNTRPGLYFAIRHNGKTTNPRGWLSSR